MYICIHVSISRCMHHATFVECNIKVIHERLQTVKYDYHFEICLSKQNFTFTRICTKALITKNQDEKDADVFINYQINAESVPECLEPCSTFAYKCRAKVNLFIVTSNIVSHHCH